MDGVIGSRWRIVMRAIMPRPPRDTPKTRYFAAIREGMDDRAAARTVAASYGLLTHRRDEGGHGPVDEARPIEWTLEEIERLCFLRYLVERGTVTEFPPEAPAT